MLVCVEDEYWLCLGDGAISYSSLQFLFVLFSLCHFLPQLPVLRSASYVADANAERAAVSDAAPLPLLFFPLVVLLQYEPLPARFVFPGAVVARLRSVVRRRRLLAEGRRLGFGHFVEEGEISHVLPRRGEGDDGRELVPPEDLVWKVRRPDLAGGRRRFDRGAHDHQQFKVSQVRVCPASTWWTKK